MSYYLPPAGIDDFSRSAKAEELKSAWHERTLEILGYIMGLREIDGEKNTRVSPLFYDHVSDKSGVPDSPPVKIPWSGFPLRLEKWFNPSSPDVRDEMNRTAEQLLEQKLLLKSGNNNYKHFSAPFRIQDEYCEWHVVRNKLDGSIKKIFFTCEPPEYWEFLAEHDRGLLVQLYRELLDQPDIQESDLFWHQDVFVQTGENTVRRKHGANTYNRFNKWNTESGAIHLTHPANSLFAEIFLASDSTLGWPVSPSPSGKIEVDSLMCCAGVGGINRSSDPLILAGVYNFAKDNKSVALANPIGLYMMPFQLDLLDPDGNQIGDEALKVVRASEDNSKWLRVEIAPPAGATYTLDQCLLGGEPLLYGGQIANLVTMAIFGVAKTIPGKEKKAINSCPSFCCTHPKHPLFKGTFSTKNSATCPSISQEEWDIEAYDIPQEANFADVNILAHTKGNFKGIKEAASADNAADNFGDNIEIAADLDETSGPISKLGSGRGVLPIDSTAPELF